MARRPLGKKPFVADRRDLKAAAFLDTTVVPKPPANFGHGLIYKDGEDPAADWDMNGNGPDDSVAPGFQGAGDCVWAAAAHTTRMAAKVRGRKVTITGKESIADYSAATGYRIGDDSTDQGTDMRQANKYRQKTGIVDAHGVRHKIGPYASITPGDWDELMQAAYVFDAVEIGFQFQAAQDDQFDVGVWDYEAGSPNEGGHAIPLFGRRTGRGGVVSWAKHLWVTRAFVENLVDEAWAIVYPESLNAKGVNERGLNVDELNAALQSLR
jgi:hypothetical protein